MPAASHELLLTRGNALIGDGRLDEARNCFEAALQVASDCPEAHFSLGQVYYLQRRIERSLASFSRAWELGIDPDRGAQERWMTLMMLGRFERAWEESDRVLRNRKKAGINCKNEPLHCQFLWDGSSFDGKRVLVRCYHGLGDTIQFIRYVPLLKRVARRVIVQAQPELIPLLRSMSAIDELIPLGADQPEPVYDVEIESMELPHAFRTTLDTIPAAVPSLAGPLPHGHGSEYRETSIDRYLAVNGKLLQSRDRQGAVNGKLRAGLVWAAGAWKPERSIPLSELAILDEIPHLALYSLQRGPAIAERPPHIRDIGSDDILEAAAAIQDLDLVITVDTMAPHLAGALDKPVWTLLHFHSDWRWMLDRRDSPWYPSMRLFRQPTPGDWKSVAQQVAIELA